MPVPVDTVDDITAVGADGELPIADGGALPCAPAAPEADRADESMSGGYASVSDREIPSQTFAAVGEGRSGRAKSDGMLLWITIAVMTVLCIVVGVCSSLLTAHFMRSGERPPVIDTGGDVQQNIAAVVSSRKNCVAEVSCGGLRGSGIVTKRDGGNVYVVTNAHVIKNYITLSSLPAVRFFGEDRFFEAQVVGYDLTYDIAVIRSVRDTLYTVYELDGNTDVFSPDTSYAEGDYVVAIGNAMGYGISAYDGIISRKSELLECNNIIADGKKTVPVMRTTAAVNAGMSGGALFDMKGRLIGLNTYRMSNSTGVDNDGGADTDVEDTGFVTPVSVFYPVYKRILADANGGEVGLASVRLRKTNTSAIGWAGLPFGFSCEYRDGKLTVISLDLNSPNKNVAEGDIITEIGGVKIADDICAAVGAVLYYEVGGLGKSLEIKATRGGGTYSFTVDNYRYAI